MLPNAANFEVTALSIATRRAKHHKMDLQTLSLEHLQNRITACQLMEGRVKKPKSAQLAWLQAGEEAEAELEKRLRSVDCQETGDGATSAGAVAASASPGIQVA